MYIKLTKFEGIKLQPELYVKLIIGAIYSDIKFLESAKIQMGDVNLFIKNQSKEFPFDLTEYYTPEMGPNLKRRFLSIEGVRKLEDSFEWKLKMETIENNLSRKGKRRINLDPGYIDSQRVVLFSRKQGPQKIYIRKGVWGDLALLKNKNGFQNLPWTFPDIREGRYHNFFLQALKEFKEENISER